jgi:hypothetical protein
MALAVAGVQDLWEVLLVIHVLGQRMMALPVR